MVLGAVPLTAQTVFQPKQSNNQWEGVIYNEEKTIEFRPHTNGFSIGVNFGKIRTYYKTTYNHFSIGYINDKREKRQNKNVNLPNEPPSRSFVFGKQNNVILLKAGKGVKRYWSEKDRRNGVAIGYHYQVGPSLAILKPYQLKLIYLEENDRPLYSVEAEFYSEENADKFLDYNSIYGGGGYFNGFNKIKLTPGVQADLGVVFDLGYGDEMIKSVEVGIMADLYIKSLPIMIETESISNKPYFINFYLNFVFGRRT